MAVSRRLWFVSRRVSRLLTLVDTVVAYGLIVMVGVLTALGMLWLGVVGTVLAAAGSAGLGFLLAQAWYAEPARSSADVQRDCGLICATTVGVMSLVGLTQVQHPWAALGLMTLPAGWLLLRWRMSGRVLMLGTAASRTSCPDRPVRPQELADLLRRLPIDVLLAEWQRSRPAMARHPGLGEEAALVGLRAALLDELEARDPEGFAAWQRAAERRPCSPLPFLSDTA